MTPVLSTYLDLVRFLAALAVVGDHIWPMIAPDHPLPWPGHEAVVVFFMLSGLVISHTTARPDRSASVYIQHRLARIWSVALPSLVISFVCACLLSTGDGTRSVGEAVAASANAVLINGVFLGQIWSLDVQPPFNAPYWSINYEVWYYAIYGLCIFVRGTKRVFLVSLAAAVAGPKILVLMPVWLLGVLVRRLRFRLDEQWAAALFVVSLLLCLLFFWFDVSLRLRSAIAVIWPWFVPGLQGSNQLVGDMILGLFFAAHLFAVSCMDRTLAPILAWRGGIKTCASVTFSVYLYHMPVFTLLWYVVGIRAPFLVVALLGAGIVLLGYGTERQLPSWRAFVGRFVPSGAR